MAIAMMCGACGRAYKVDDKWAGRKMRCKQCGAVMQAPGGETRAKGAAPAPAGRPRGQAAARPVVDDPFENVDALLALEKTGEVEEEDPRQMKAKMRAVRRQQAQETPEEVDDRVGVAVARKKSVRKVGPQISYARPGADGLMFVDEAYFTIPGEEHIDKWVPIASIGLFVLTLLSPIFLMFYSIFTRPEGREVRWDVVWRFVRNYSLASAVVCLIVFGIMGGLASIGVMVAAAIMKFPKPSGVFKKCGAALSFPIMLHLLIIGIAAMSPLAAARMRGGVPWLWWVLLPFLIVGMLWLLLRLRPAPFGVAAGLSTALGLGLPFVIFLVFAMAMGYDTSLILGKGRTGGVAAGGGGTAWPAPGGPGGNKPGGARGGGNPANSNPNPLNSRIAPPAGRDPSTRNPGAGGSAGRAPVRPPPDDEAGRAQSEQRLRKIFDAMGKYAAANAGRYPATARELESFGIAPEEARTPWGSPYHLERVPVAATGALPADLMLGFDVVPRQNQRLTLFGDGRVEWVEMSRWGEMINRSMRARAELMRQQK